MGKIAGKRIWIAGHNGLVGSAMMRRLAREACDVLTVQRSRLDLTRQDDVADFLIESRPDAIVFCAARVGGILANDTEPVPFLLDNLQMATSVFAAAHAADVDRILYLGSSCVYPRDAAQPMAEDALLTGPLEATNQWYAIAKIAGIKLAQAYRKQFGRDYVSAMPTNLYGPGDNFDLATSHVLPGLIARIHAAHERGARSVPIWGTGTPRREFLHVDDCADALVCVLRDYSDAMPINIGSGQEIPIAELATLVAEIIGYRGALVFDSGKPDGTPRKLLDCTRLDALGWRPAIGLREGITATYRWYRNTLERRAA